MNLTGKNEWNPSSVSLGSADSTQDQVQEPGFKEHLLATRPRTISKTTRFDDALEDIPTSQTYSLTDRHYKISAEVLADRFIIGIDRENATLKSTLQRGTGSAILPIRRRYRADRQYGVKQLKGKFSTNTIRGKSKSIQSKAITQVYSHKFGFTTVYHIDKANNENFSIA